MTFLLDALVKHGPLLIVFMWGVAGIGLLLHQQWGLAAIFLIGAAIILHLYLTIFKEM